MEQRPITGLIFKLHFADDVQYYVTSGNATFTLYNPGTGRHFTYNMRKRKTSNGSRAYEIRLLTGDDNTNSRKYHFIGVYYLHNHGRKSVYLLHDKTPSVADNAIRVMLLRTEWYLEQGAEVLRSNKCAKCGRLLTETDSIITGYGPKCGGRR